MEIKNLSTPIQFVWALPAETRASRLPTSVNYTCNGTVAAAPYNNMTCPNGKPLNATCDGSEAADDVKEAICPAPQLEGGCLYWNTAAGNWTSDGCRATYIDADTLICTCDHLTDFGARFDAVLSSNLNVFKNFGSIYSLETFLRLWPLYAFIGSWIVVFIIVLAVLGRLDRKAAAGYIEKLAACTEVRDLLHILPEGSLIDRCLPTPTVNPEDVWPSKEAMLAGTEEVPTGFWRRLGFTIKTWWRRLFYQHSYFAIFFRFDPRLPRIYRATFIFVTIFHTLFITTLLYGFSHGAPSGSAALPEMTVGESIVLSVISSALNIVFLQVFFIMMNSAGTAEFKFRYPYLYEELLRRHKIERALSTIPEDTLMTEIKSLRQRRRQRGGKNQRRASIPIYDDFTGSGGTASGVGNTEGRPPSPTTNVIAMYPTHPAHPPVDPAHPESPVTSEDEIMTSSSNNALSAFGEMKIFQMALSLCKRRRKTLPRTSTAMSRVFTIQQARKYLTQHTKYPKGPITRCQAFFPLHTVRGWVALCIPVGWFVWCTQYLLAFAAAQTNDIADKLFQSYGISQLMTIFVSQPLTLLVTLLLTVVFFAIVSRLAPQRCRRAKTGPVALEFFSDPLAGKESTALSSNFAYWIFLRAPADVSIRTPWTRSMDLACATPRAAAGFLESNILDTAEGTDASVLEQRIVAIYALWRGLVA